MTEQQVVNKLGPPSWISEMILQQGRTLPEMYVEIHNIYSPKDPKTEGIVIKELRWTCYTHQKAVFLHYPNGAEWIVFQSLRWRNGVEF